MVVYLSEILAGLRRRWWLVLVGVVLTAAGAAYVVSLVPAEQVARASVLLVPPEVVVGDTGNPYLGLNGLQPAADVLARALNDGQAHADLAPPEGTGDFVVIRDTSSSGPVLVVEVTDTDPDGAIAMLDDVLAAMPPMLEQLQADVEAPTSSFIKMTVVTRDDLPEASTKTQIRALLVSLVGGLALTVFLTYAVDGLLVRRGLERRRGGRSVTSAGHVAPGTPTPGSPHAIGGAPTTPPVPTQGTAPHAPATGSPAEPRPHPRPTPGQQPGAPARPAAARPEPTQGSTAPVPPGFVGNRSKSR
ncbi:hypothetical protein ACTHAM_001967 [Cellulomonas soli]|uniref:hypothetical protein n=1 Tax=Cellulomonas soli TaxID=931535 RepID=UPI003F8504A2